MRFSISIPDIDYKASDNIYFPSLSNNLSSIFPYLPDNFYRYGSIKNGGSGFHTFVDDWRLEAIWRDKHKCLDKFVLHPFVMLPDFTIDTNAPLVMHIYQVWRSRVLGRWYFDHNLPVIPVLQWGNSDFHNVVFDGLKNVEVIAVRGAQKGSEFEWHEAVEFYLSLYSPVLVLHFGRKFGFNLWHNALHFSLRGKQDIHLCLAG